MTSLVTPCGKAPQKEGPDCSVFRQQITFNCSNSKDMPGQVLFYSWEATRGVKNTIGQISGVKYQMDSEIIEVLNEEFVRALARTSPN